MSNLYTIKTTPETVRTVKFRLEKLVNNLYAVDLGLNNDLFTSYLVFYLDKSKIYTILCYMHINF